MFDKILSARRLMFWLGKHGLAEAQQALRPTIHHVMLGACTVHQ